MSAAPRPGRAPGAPLGPESVLWRIAGDGRSMLTGTSAGILQLLHPGLGAGVVDHSAFFSDQWGRILRSIPQIWGTIFAPDEREGAARGRAIRDLHRSFAGTDGAGRRYHALDPDVFWWAHATFTWEFLRAAQLYLPRPLRPTEAEQLYAETVTWYRRYGVSDRVVPVDLAAFRARFRELCATDLELTPAADRAIQMAQEAKAPDLVLERLPGPVAATLGRVALWPVGQVMRLLTLGALPARVRHRFGVTWTRLDQTRFLTVRVALRGSGLVVPPAVWAALIPPGTPTARTGDAKMAV